MPRSPKPMVPTKTSHVLDTVRDLIIEGEYRPDRHLYVDEVAQRLQVSQTPVREALRQLEAEGLVTSLPHHGWVVAQVSFEQIREIFLIRRVLEGLATELATPRLTDADLAELERIHAETAEAVEQLDFPRCRHLNLAFHRIIYRAANAPQLTRFLQMTWTRLPFDLMATVRGMAEGSHDDHRTLLDALKRGDAQRAAELMRDHMAGMMECYARWGRAAGLDRGASRDEARMLFDGVATDSLSS